MRPWTSPEDPQAAADANDVEAILGTVASMREVTNPVRERLSATRALWLCACDTFDYGYLWLIYDNDEGLTWCRVPDGLDVNDLVVADKVAGTHTGPGQVLRWLEGATLDEVYGDAGVAEELGRSIRGS